MTVPTYLLLLCALLPCTTASAPSGPWDDLNYAPASRIVYPQRIHGTNGDVEHADGLLSANAGSTTLSGADAWVTIDFGKEVWLSQIQSCACSLSYRSVVSYP